MNPFNFNQKPTFNMSGNPMDMIMKYAQSNPSFQPIVQALNSGANPQALFYQLCQQRGIDPNDILKQIK